MIKLTKGPEPDILKAKGGHWLEVLENKIAAGEVPTETEKSRYRHPDIKAALKKETNGKCAYCESRLLHIAFGDVEHIVAKSQKLADIFQWDNLTLACDICNTYKKDKVGVVDPYKDDPANMFRFVGPMIFALPDNDAAIISIKQLKLNRIDLMANRSKRLDAIDNLVHTISTAKSEELRLVLLEDLVENEAANSAEYAAFVRSYITLAKNEIGLGD